MTVDQIFEKFGTNAALGRAIGRNPVRASEMRKRGVIPVEYWTRLIAHSKEEGIQGIDADALMRAHTPPEYRNL